jgi:hypothetical protein
VRTFLAASALTLALPAAAPAAVPSRTPTPKQLWNRYPLQPNGSGALPSPTARPVVRPAGRAARVAKHHGISVALLLAVALSFGIGAALAWAGLRWRATLRPSAVETRSPPADPHPRRFEPSSLRPPARPPPPAPPVPAARAGVALAEAPLTARDTRWPATTDRLWRCELVWRPPDVIARLLAPGTVSPPSPESAPRETPALTAAAAQLDAELRGEGWTPLDTGDHWFDPRGNGWFDHRYVWTRPEPPPGMEGAG